MDLPRASHIVGDIALCLTFFTRIPCPLPANGRSFADALWAVPLVGALVGGLSSAAVLLALAVNLPPTVAALFALAVSILLTGALHEDGAADTADGFGGGKSPDDALQIMRDSRIGSYGTLALIFSVGSRWAALAAIAGVAEPMAIVGTLVAAHACSRSVIPAFAGNVPPARQSGLSAGIGEIRPATWATSLSLGFILSLGVGLAFAGVSIIALAACFLVIDRLCRRSIGGQSGDVLGALQQVCEATLLLVAAALLV